MLRLFWDCSLVLSFNMNMQASAVNEQSADAQLVSSKPATEILDLGDIDLNSVLDDLDTTCSPFSDGQLKNLSSCCTGSISSDNPYYFWYVKNRADAIKKSTRLAQGDVDNNSTCGMINIRYSTKINMCENPSDMWHGLKMSDGTPVVMRASRRNRFKTPARDIASRRRLAKCGKSGSFGPMATAAAFGEAGVAAMYQKSAAIGIGGSSSAATATSTGTAADASAIAGVGIGIKGPIDYSGGFLAIGHYIGRKRRDLARRLVKSRANAGDAGATSTATGAAASVDDVCAQVV